LAGSAAAADLLLRVVLLATTCSAGARRRVAVFLAGALAPPWASASTRAFRASRSRADGTPSLGRALVTLFSTMLSILLPSLSHWPWPLVPMSLAIELMLWLAWESFSSPRAWVLR